MRAVVALGGNAISPPSRLGAIADQRATIGFAARILAAIASRGVELVVTHGNGPQVGALLLQNIAAQKRTPPMPLDVLVAESQAQIGYLLQQALGETLSRPVATIVTQTVVDPNDPAFENPSKPIGPSMLAPAARALQAHGIPVARDEFRGGWRRVVPSPRPIRFVEEAAIGALLADGTTPIAAGGGGVPVVPGDGGGWRGVEGVVDKDLAAAVLARCTKADALVILTDVEHVVLERGTERERSVGRFPLAEAKQRLAAGEFPTGSMGPKLDAAVQAAQEGRRAIITSLEAAADALDGSAGTEIVS